MESRRIIPPHLSPPPVSPRTAVLAMSLVLMACQDMSTQEALTCLGAAALTTAIGAAAGGGKGAAAGAAVGVAACVVIHFAMRQTKDASQVDADYRHAHNGQLPAQPAIVNLDVHASPSAVVRRGGELTIVSNVDVVSGKSEPVKAVTEEIRLYEYGKSEPFKTDSKDAKASAGSGGYQTNFTISLPGSMPQGQYRVCAVKRWRFPAGVSPARQPLQPEATGAVMEVTKWLKPSVKRVTNWWQRECAGRNVSER